MNLAKHESERLENILIKDKLKSPERFCAILKRETENFLANFFDFEPNSTNISIVIDELGYYKFSIKGIAKRIRICR